VITLFASLSLALAIPPDQAAADALSVGGCSLCHQADGMPLASRQDSCHDCHVWIRDVSNDPDKRHRALQLFPLWERYETNVTSYLSVPNLDAAMARLEPAWFQTWLADPHDVRPSLPEGMPRFDLTEAQTNAIVSWFTANKAQPATTPPPDPNQVNSGRQLYETKGCPACHSFGNQPALGLYPMAPDLAHARSRMHPDMIAAWIQDPSAVSSQATMPAIGLTRDEAIAIRDYLVLTPLSWTPQPPLTSDPSPTNKPVVWADVEERVFAKICVHCHMDPAQNQGRAGPGNAGGFGWDATGIELQTYEGVVAVADQIPDVLSQRRREAHRDVVSPGHHPAQIVRLEKPGMPLGLPPLSNEDHALILGWIAQGMPR